MSGEKRKTNGGKRKMSEAQAYTALTARCAVTEYCLADIRRMMDRWELPDGAAERIEERLVKERFVDHERYAHAFVRDKLRFAHWGKQKICQQLRLKGIEQALIDDACTEIADDHLETLRQLIAAKRRTVKASSEYELNAKLCRFAYSRGFSFSEINEVLHTSFEDGD